MSANFRSLQGKLVPTQQEGWSEKRYGRAEGLRLRNARARALRKAGYQVRSQTLDFTDLARDRRFVVEYWRKPNHAVDE